MSAAVAPEMLEKAWEALDSEAAAFGERHAQRLAFALRQGRLVEVDTLREHFLQEEAEANPDKLVVTAEVFEDFRFRAGIAASLIDEAEVRRADWSYMWDRVIDSTLGANYYDILTRSYTLSEQYAARIFAKDYELTASQRLMGGKLIEFDDEKGEE